MTAKHPILPLDAADRRGLAWVRQWARQRLTGLKRRRKYRPRERTLDPEEMAALHALLQLEQAAGELLEDSSSWCSGSR